MRRRQKLLQWEVEDFKESPCYLRLWDQVADSSSQKVRRKLSEKQTYIKILANHCCLAVKLHIGGSRVGRGLGSWMGRGVSRKTDSSRALLIHGKCKLGMLRGLLRRILSIPVSTKPRSLTSGTRKELLAFGSGGQVGQFSLFFTYASWLTTRYLHILLVRSGYHFSIEFRALWAATLRATNTSPRQSTCLERLWA